MIPLLLVPVIAFVVFATIAVKPHPAVQGEGRGYNSDLLIPRTTFECPTPTKVGFRPHAQALLVSIRDADGFKRELQFRTSHRRVRSGTQTRPDAKAYGLYGVDIPELIVRLAE